MLPRVLGWIVVIATAVAAAVLLWPQAVGANDQWVAAHVVALRGVGAAAGIIAAVIFLAIAMSRRARVFAIAMAIVFIAFAGGNVLVLSERGLQNPADAAAERSDADVTVLSWNTFGEGPGAEAIAELALAEHADVVVLPETTEQLGEEIAVEMREAGRPMWVHAQQFSDYLKAQSTTLLISPELGDYQVTSADWTGPPYNTNTLPTVVADSSSGMGPRIVAVHAVAPIRWELRNWRSDLDWLALQCAGDDVIMAGDFNATLDHFAGRGVDGGDLGRCTDAAAADSAAGIGTWPTDLPELLGSPIDHIVSTPNWSVVDFRVLTRFDDAGSDHRPIVSTLSPVD